MPSVSSEDDSSSQLKRVASVSLPSLATRSGNIDVSQQGTIALHSNETVYIFTPALNTTALLKPDISLACHDDPSQKVPFFRSSISIKSCPIDTSKSGSGLEADMISYEARFMDAKWSTSDIGLYTSPILAALTTQSQIFLYIADTNQFKGPWRQLECLTGGEERHLVSMTWIQGSSTYSWLLAGTKQGEVVAWKVGPDGAQEHCNVPISQGEVTGLSSSPTGNLFLSTSKGVQLAEIVEIQGELSLKQSSHQMPLLSGSHVSTAKWHGSEVMYCTPGEAHLYDIKTGIGQSVLLESSDDEESCSFRPAAAITPLEVGNWEVYLNDGTMYSISPKIFKMDFIRPASYLSPPNEVIGSLQRQVESARGLFANSNDGAGLSYLCHDGNEIASWSYYREPKCQFGLALTAGCRLTQELSMATQLLEAALKGEPRHLRTFIVFYKYTASSKAKIWTMALQALHREKDLKQHLQAALRLSVWMQREESKDANLASIHASIFELSLGEAMCGRVQSTLTHMSSVLDAEDIQHCSRLAKAGYTVSIRVKNVTLQRLSSQLMKNIDKRTSLEALSTSFDLGETCKACSSSVTFQAAVNFLFSKCQKGHVWKRCATSLALLTTSTNRFCSICSSETIQPTQATSTLQRRLIESITSCDLCNGTLFH